ncbi:POLY protein, partial [Crocuta crocuta]
VIHEFLYLPDCPVALMGHDILGKVQAQITFNSQGQVALTLRKPEAKIMSLTIPQGEEWHLYSFNSLKEKPQLVPELPFKVSKVWAEDNPPALARNIPPVVVELKPGAEPTCQRQYFIPRKAQVGIQKHLERLLKYGILRLCQSPWNTPLLPVQKPGTDDYRPVQDLRAVNQGTVTIYPVVQNPYTLLGLIPAEATFFTCLDLKDAFFCICLPPQSQLIFAFQWEDPKNGDRGQLTWTRLPQGFKNSPTIFGTALPSDLEAF